MLYYRLNILYIEEHSCILKYCMSRSCDGRYRYNGGITKPICSFPTKHDQYCSKHNKNMLFFITFILYHVKKDTYMTHIMKCEHRFVMQPLHNTLLCRSADFFPFHIQYPRLSKSNSRTIDLSSKCPTKSSPLFFRYIYILRRRG
jgi:hypothetical protein